jgi:hypothetical protein
MFIFAFAMGFLINCFTDIFSYILCCFKKSNKDKEEKEKKKIREFYMKRQEMRELREKM